MFGKLLIVGDIHLGKGTSLGKTKPGDIYNTRHLDQINLLSWILEQVKINEIEMVILTGDIFEDAKPDYSLIQIFLQFLFDLSKLCVECHIIVGNHDLKRIGQKYYSVLEILETINIEFVFLHKQISTIQHGDLNIVLIPFMDRRYLECDSQKDAVALLRKKIDKEISDLPESTKKMVIGHLTLDGALYVGDEVDDLINEIFCPLDLFDKFDYVWMGHIHKPQVLKKKPYLAHIGSLDLSNFEESNQKKILIIIDQNSKDFFEEIIIPTRPLKSFIIDVPEPEQLCIKNTEEYEKYSTEYVLFILENDSCLKNSIVRIEVKLPAICPPLFRKEIETYLYDSGVHNISSFSESRKNIVVKNEKSIIDNSIEPKQAVILWAKEKLPENSQSDYIFFMHNIIDKVLAKK